MFGFIFNLFKNKSKDFETFEWLNHTNFGLETSGFSPGLLGSYSTFLNSKIGVLKNSNFSKWDYQNADDIDFEKLEQELFFKGSAVIWKASEKGVFLINGFSVDEFGSNNNPKKITINLKNNTNVRLTPNKDCILFYNDSSFLFGKPFMGNLFRIWSKLVILERCYLEIYKSIVLTNNKLTVPIDTSDKTLQSIVSSIMSASPVLKFSQGKSLRLPNSTVIDQLLLKTENRSQELIFSYKFIWNEILSEMGIKTVESKKERNLTDEISAQNEVPNFINQAQLKMRLISWKKFNKLYNKNVVLKLQELNNSNNSNNDNSKPEERNYGNREKNIK